MTGFALDDGEVIAEDRVGEDLRLALGDERVDGEREIAPFLTAQALFLLCYIGIGISFYPYIVPRSVTIAAAAAPIPFDAPVIRTRLPRRCRSMGLLAEVGDVGLELVARWNC